MRKLFIFLTTIAFTSIKAQTSDNLTFTVNGVSFTMVKVDGGTFMMGATDEQEDDWDPDERPIHQVTLSDYYIGETEVTQELWEAVMGDTPSYYNENAQYPVEFISWYDCVDFITKLNALTGQHFCLPSEAQWEFAARGGNKSRGYKYAGSDDIEEVAWFWRNSGDKYCTDATWNSNVVGENNCRTHLVKTKKPNELGIYDMSGNVEEWCLDIYDHYSESILTDPIKWWSNNDPVAVVRGGSYYFKKERSRVSYRKKEPHYSEIDFIGLRLALYNGEKDNIYQNPIEMMEIISKKYPREKTLHVSNSYTFTNNHFSLEECGDMVSKGNGAEAISSLLHYKELSSSPYCFVDPSVYCFVEDCLIKAYVSSKNWGKAQNELNELFDEKKQFNLNNIPVEYGVLFYLHNANLKYVLKDYFGAKEWVNDAIDYAKANNYMGANYIQALRMKIDVYCLLGEITQEMRWVQLVEETFNEYKSAFIEEIGDMMKSVGSDPIVTYFYYVSILMIEARIDASLNKYDEAIGKYEQMVTFFKKYDNDFYSAVAYNLSLLYMMKNDITYHDKAVSLLETINSNKAYDDDIYRYKIIAACLQENKNIDSLLYQYNSISKEKCLDVFNNFSEGEREPFWIKTCNDLITINNFSAYSNSFLTSYAYDNVLFANNLAQQSSDILNKLVWDNIENKELQNLYRYYCELCNRTAKGNESNLEKEQRTLLEKEMLQFFPNYKIKLSASFRTWQDVQNALDNNEIAIEFTYIPEMKSLNDVKFHYGALVLRKNDTLPIMVKLCDKQELDSLLNKMGSATINSLYNSDSIYKQIWAPLEPYLKDKKTIYFSPTGTINFINHNAICTTKGTPLGEKYKLVRLSSTSKIGEYKKNTTKNYVSALIYGGINYNVDNQTWKEVVANVQTPQNKPLQETQNPVIDLAYTESKKRSLDDERGNANYLQGSLMESNNIRNILKVDTLNVLQGYSAVEESFKAYDHYAPSIIHFATHGFFADKNEDLEKISLLTNAMGGYSKQADLLKRTYLLMAGANYLGSEKYKENGEKLPEGVKDDGYLTAEEISRMDLRGAKLVVMSACESGKGFESVDGVVGLQRGFKKAGAETIVMSLWTVDDESTSYLMQRFYTYLMEGDGTTVRDALRQAMKDTQNDSNHPSWKDPYYWAGFVVLD